MKTEDVWWLHKDVLKMLMEDLSRHQVLPLYTPRCSSYLVFERQTMAS